MERGISESGGEGSALEGERCVRERQAEDAAMMGWEQRASLVDFEA